VTQDQTLFGLAFHQPPKQGGYFDAGAGVRISLPLDPYVKGSYVYDRGSSDRGLFSVRETVFWQHSQGLGATSRMDTERIYDLRWLARLTGSAGDFLKPHRDEYTRPGAGGLSAAYIEDIASVAGRRIPTP
jgi:hypothetical protein